MVHQGHKSSLEKALNRIREILGAVQANRLAPYITVVAPITGSALKFKRIAHAPDVEALSDYIAEIRFGLIFAGLHYEIGFEPLGEKGPDLVISRDGQSAYVEVKRFRSSIRQQEVNVLTDDLMFKQYGNPLKDIAKIRAELLGKFIQVQVCGRNGIIAFWSDNDELEDLEFGFAVTDVRSDVENQIHQLPEGFLFTVFGSDWRNVSQNQQLFCRVVKPLTQPFVSWAGELESVMVNDCLRAAINRLGTGTTNLGLSSL
jgi:hypothetical protein